jgi:hypothetical protein
MLDINIPDEEFLDERTNRFFTIQGATLLLEHSLVSLSKWEAIHGKPFLDGVKKTTEETQSYVACMNLAPVPDQKIYSRLSEENVATIAAYIDSKQTATWFKEDPNARRSTEIITNEIIYYWMIAHSIPLETQYWHLNKLLTLIKVCNEKNKPAKRSKMPTRDQATSRTLLNQQRKTQLGTTG